MIIRDDNILIDVVLEGRVFDNLCFYEVEELLCRFKYDYNNLKPKEIVEIPDCFAYFSNDVDNNKFICKIYKTSFGTDRWIMLMKNNYEGYALYENPGSHEYELAWYCSKLDEPLTDSEEEKIRTCYNPISKK